MKNRDIIVLKKILEYCNQVSEAYNMFDNDYDKFVSISVFKMPAVCVSCKMICQNYE